MTRIRYATAIMMWPGLMSSYVTPTRDIWGNYGDETGLRTEVCGCLSRFICIAERLSLVRDRAVSKHGAWRPQKSRLIILIILGRGEGGKGYGGGGRGRL